MQTSSLNFNNRLGGMAFVGLLAAALIVGVSQKADAAPGDITIVRVGTDAMGADSFQNRNREYVSFRNTSASNTGVDVSGYTVMDEWRKANLNNAGSCNKYTIGATLPGKNDAVLEPGKYVTVFNGWGVDKAVFNGYVLFANSNNGCGLDGHFYNNRNDTAYLMNGVTQIDSKGWNWHGGYHVS